MQKAFDADVFLVFLPENLDELLMKGVFETIFCLHEVGQFFSDVLTAEYASFLYFAEMYSWYIYFLYSIMQFNAGFYLLSLYHKH